MDVILRIKVVPKC